MIQFSPEDWWKGDMNGMVHNVPLQIFIDALEDCGILLFENNTLQKLTACIPRLAPLYQAALQKIFAAKSQRIVSSFNLDG